jgi:carboxypeptidase Q
MSCTRNPEPSPCEGRNGSPTPQDNKMIEARRCLRSSLPKRGARGPIAIALLLFPALALGGSVEDAVLQRVDDTTAIEATVDHLTNGVGPRLTGSEALLAAHRYAASRFEAMGLTVSAESFPIQHSWERGPAWGEIMSPFRLSLRLAQAGWTPPTPGVVQGPLCVVAPRTNGDMKSLSGSLAGRIVLAGSPASDLEPLMMVPPLRVDPAGARPRKKEYEGPSHAELVEFLEAEGALAILKDSGKPDGMLDMEGDDRAVSGAQGLPTAYVIHEQYLLLTRLAEEGASARLSFQGRRGEGTRCVNTVASMPGYEHRDEYVAVGAHLDSWDLGTGALDNATGAAAVIEAARLLVEVGARPRRTLRFVLFSGEEQGMLGSRAYVEGHRGELGRHSAVFVLDTGTGRVDGLALQGRAAVQDALNEVLSPLVPLGVVDTDLRYEWDTDHISFDEAGVPAFCFEQVQHDYSRVHHSEADTLDKVKPPELEQAAVVLALTAYRTAQLPGLLPRDR